MFDPSDVNQCEAIRDSLESLLNLGVACASRVSLRVGLEHLEKLGVPEIQFIYTEYSLLHLTQIPK